MDFARSIQGTSDVLDGACHLLFGIRAWLLVLRADVPVVPGLDDGIDLIQDSLGLPEMIVPFADGVKVPTTTQFLFTE